MPGVPRDNCHASPAAAEEAAAGKSSAFKDDPELDPYEIDFLPDYRMNRGPRGPFLNSQGVVIGDHDYDSPQSPLNHWSAETDPAVMSGEEWVHPFKDIGFQTEENRQLFEKGIRPQSGIYMHPELSTSYEARRPEIGCKDQVMRDD
ncbi:DUF3905 domain-containing protein [Paenibacillus sambharensis]|uniref:DUF3905 domain-containing protein n=1 Tax=Paenibacillus sambharensis TaxID=1803190 RepID=A0A2W1LMJ9_9BACL|nr:DUF3905 domain-containing protein [Paenibacillus sambharensis]PZD95664.1 DUF3905 domain-containing protein [Paenibacillus sambharensis]